jgi:hypothetical protein
MGKTKSNEKSKKNVKIQVSKGSKIVLAAGPKPTEEDIRKKASELYYERIQSGENGSAEEDWAEAERCFKDLEE